MIAIPDIRRLSESGPLEAMIVQDTGYPGRARRWRCPICRDTDENLAYNPRRNRFVCYRGSCGESGDIFDWLQLMHQMPLLEAVVYLGGHVPTWDERQTRAVRSRVAATVKPAPPLLDPSQRPQEQPDAYLDPHYQAVVDRIVRHAFEAYWDPDRGRDARRWTKWRGIHESTARRHSLGWIPRGFETEPIEVLRNDEGERGIYVPRGILFPYRSAEGWFGLGDGKPDGPQWTGGSVRRLPDPDVFARLPPRPDGRRTPKMMMLRETPRRSFYPNPDIMPSQGQRPAVLVEGEIDALLLEQEIGHAAFVATLGGANCYPDDEALATLEKCPQVLLAGDFDAAGEASVARWKTVAPHAKRAFAPELGEDEAKDAGEFVQGGGSVRDWIMPEFGRFGWPWPRDR